MEISYLQQYLLVKFFMRGFLLPVIMLIVFGGIFGVTEATDAQDLELTEIKISLDVDQVPLKKVLSKIEGQTDLSFAFSYSAINPDREVSVKAHDISVEEVLKHLFNKQKITWGLSGKTILLKKWMTSEQGSLERAMEELIGGTVVDAETGETMPGVNIVVKGTTIGTSTGQDGSFELTVPSLSDTLVVSFVGYQTQEVPIAGRTEINIELKSEAITGEELVVVGYGEQERTSVTGSINSVSTEDITRVPTASIANALSGQTRGLQIVQTSGEPGRDDPEMYLRGIGSLSEGRSQPLFVLDGVVMRDMRSISRLDPDNIESISILKDASATAVYGVEGANGVISVKTKRGRQGSMNISINTSAGVQAPTLLQENVDSYTLARAYNQAQINDGVHPDLVRFSDEVIEAFRTGKDPLIYPDTDWIDYISKEASLQTRTNVSLSGGTEFIQYYVAGGYQFQDGFFKTFDAGHDFNPSYDRYNLRSNLDINVTPSTQLSVNAGGRVGSWVHTRRMQWHHMYMSVPFAGAGVVDGKLIQSGDRYIPGPKRHDFSFYGSGYNQNTRSVLNLNLSGTQQLDFITSGLELQVKGAYNAYFTEHKFRPAAAPYYEPYYRTDVDNSAPGDSTIVFKKIGEEEPLGYNESYGKDRDWYAETRLEYDSNFGPHDVKGLLLYGQRKRYYPNQYSGIPRGLINSVGRVNYGYDDRYLFEFSVGYNGSENFAKENRFGVFPAVSAGWIVTNEPYIPDVSFLDHFKLRASYGLVGNDSGIGRFLYLPDTYNSSAAGYNFGNDVPQNQPGATEGEIGNPGVTWEKSRKQNYGVDIRLFNNKLDLTFDYFHEYRYDILTNLNNVPSYVSSDLPAVNVGEVENRGYEVEVEWQQQVNDFFYSVGGHVSFARNKILDMDEVTRNEPYQQRTGEPVGQEFGWVFDGFYTEEDIANFGNGVPEPTWSVKPGFLKYKDLNGDGVVDEDDVRPIGYTKISPEYTFGSTISLGYKNLDLSMTWAGATNISEELLQAPNRVPFGANGDRSMRQWQWDHRWTPDKDPDEILFPRLSIAAGQQRNQLDSDFWLIDASYIRLKNVEIGYTFRGLSESFGAKNMRVYLNAVNPLTFSHMMSTYSIDPEQSGYRAELDYPIMKVYNFGVKLDL